MGEGNPDYCGKCHQTPLECVNTACGTRAPWNETLDLADQIPTFVPDDVSRETSGPAPMLKGKFALFEKPDGGIHLAYRPDGADEDEHFDVPGFYVQMAKKAGKARGGLFGMFGKAG